MKRIPQFAFALATVWLPAAFAETKLLENFTLIDGAGGPAVTNAALLVVDGKIQYAGPKSGVKAPAGAERIDLTGKFVMPGIINLHGHLGNTVGLVQDPKNFTSENLNKQLATYAQFGVTTMVTMGSEQDLIFAERQKQRAAGRDPHTRIFTAYRGFTGVEGYPTKAPGMHGVPFEVSKPEQVEAALKILADKKVDLVKIWVDDHLGKEPKISIELCKQIIAGAKKRGLPVAAHIFYLDDAKKLVKAGLHGVAHSVRDKAVDDEFIQLMKKRGAYQIATLTREASMFAYAENAAFLNDPLFAKAVDPETLKTVRSAAYQKKQASDKETHLWPGFLKNAQMNLKKLYDSGVKVGFGTDTGPPSRFSGYFEHWEMELMAQAGLTPGQIIQTFSRNAAEYLGKSSELGTLAKGHWADLIILTKNPLDDIRHSKSIETVWIAGLKVN